MNNQTPNVRGKGNVMKCLFTGCVNDQHSDGLCYSCHKRFYEQAKERVSKPNHCIKGRMPEYKHDYQNPIHSNYDLIHDMNSIGPGHKLKDWDVKD